MTTITNTQNHTRTLRGQARIAGLWYLALAVLGGFGIMYPTGLLVSGDAAATLDNIQASESLFRLSIVSDLAGQIAFVFLGLALFQLFKTVNRGHATAMLVLVLVSVPISMLAAMNHGAALLLANNPAYLQALGGDQLAALTSLFMEIRAYGITIAQIFWGLWLFPFGYLVYKSEFMPRLIGILLMVGCAAYMLDTLLIFLAPATHEALAVYLMPFFSLGEFSVLGWLLIKGVTNDAADRPLLRQAAA